MARGRRTFGRRRRKFVVRRLGVPALFLLAVLIIYLSFPSRGKQPEVSATGAWLSGSAPLSDSSSLSYVDLEPSLANRRPTFPYSVIPGGVRTVDELRSAIAQDLLVKAHYQGFNLAKARVIRLKESREVYVSYRRDGAILWTSRKLVLRQGETVITDGTNLSRTRCGNRIADTPSYPRSPNDPSSEVFDTPIVATAFPPLDPAISDPPPVILTASPSGGSIFIPPIFPISSGRRPIFVPPIVPIFPGGGSSGGSSPPPSFGPPISSVTSVPEPGSLYLLLTSLPLAWLIRTKPRR
jgi:hypothetical protein